MQSCNRIDRSAATRSTFTAWVHFCSYPRPSQGTVRRVAVAVNSTRRAALRVTVCAVVVRGSPPPPRPDWALSLLVAPHVIGHRPGGGCPHVGRWPSPLVSAAAPTRGVVRGGGGVQEGKARDVLRAPPLSVSVPFAVATCRHRRRRGRRQRVDAACRGHRRRAPPRRPRARGSAATRPTSQRRAHRRGPLVRPHGGGRTAAVVDCSTCCRFRRPCRAWHRRCCSHRRRCQCCCGHRCDSDAPLRPLLLVAADAPPPSPHPLCLRFPVSLCTCDHPSSALRPCRELSPPFAGFPSLYRLVPSRSFPLFSLVALSLLAPSLPLSLPVALPFC